MVRIYTRTGDKGETGLIGGRRVGKDSPRIEAIGAVDELNAAIGLARSFVQEELIDSILHTTQENLFRLGADIATPLEAKTATPAKRMTGADVEALESTIDSVEAQLQPLRRFIMPGGSQPAAQLHLARAVCRRAERRLVALSKTEAVNNQARIYLNRLSDLLFVLARLSNFQLGIRDIEWKPD